MEKKNYVLDDSDDSLIENAIEKLFQNKEQLVGKTISWETLTTSYLKRDLPNNDMDSIYWVRLRPTWVQALNKKFIEAKYPCRLKTVYGYGVDLLINGNAVNDALSYRTKKVTKAMQLSIKLFDDYQVCFPEAKKILKISSNIMTETLFGILGRIENSRLPASQRNELKSVIQKCLPESDEE